MRKIHHGFIALAILGGPAFLILAHQKLTEEVPSSGDITTLLQQAYSRCSRAPRSGRPSQCDAYILAFDQCTARGNGCDPRSVYEVFLELNVSSAHQEDQQPTRPL